MKSSALLQIEARHVKALLNSLDRYAEKFFTEDAAAGKVWRIFFVDTDLLSVYANGQTRDPINAWSSLLSLEDAQRGASAAPEAIALANAAGQSIVKYLFGAFLLTLQLQRGRLYIAPEHEREYKSVVHSILGADAVGPGWLGALQHAYEEIANPESEPERAVEAAKRIVSTLTENAAAGASDRAYQLLRSAVSTLSTNLIVTPEVEPTSILFSTADPDYRAFIQQNRDTVWEAFERGLSKRIDHAEDLFVLKRFVFDLHDADSGADRPYAFFLNRIRSWLNSANAPPALANRHDLESLIRIAVREAADLSALVRMNALGQWLTNHRRPADGQQWEIVLVSGSGRLARTVESWADKDTPCYVSVIHPINLLRHVDFWDPAGTGRLGTAAYLDQPHEFALSLIFGAGRRKDDPQSAGPDASAFVQSLQEQLDIVVAREALADRGLTRLRSMLEATFDFDRAQFTETLRDLVTQRFAQTYNRLTELFPGEKSALPASSLPSLDLSRSEAAMDFLLLVRAALADGREPVQFEGLLQSLKEDRSAYSALLALATGYMARGHRWIPAAQTMAATATLLAKGRVEKVYPEGNEALYLEAFLLRMSLTVKADASEFVQKHTNMMGEAKRTLAQWAMLNPTDAERPIGTGSSPSRMQWVGYRYELEDNARAVFQVLIQHFQRVDSAIRNLADLEQLTEHSLSLHSRGVALASTGSTWKPAFEPSIWYCGIQAGLSTLQSWLLWSEAVTRDGHSRARLSAFESRIARKVTDLWIHRDKLGVVLPLLARIYAQRTGFAQEWLSARAPTSELLVRFAGIDEHRMRWFRELILAPSARRLGD